MKFIYSLVFLSISLTLFSQQTLYNAAIVPKAGAPSGFIDFEIKVTFNESGVFGSSNFFIGIDPAKLSTTATPQIITSLNPAIYVTSFLSNSPELMSINIALNNVPSAVPVATGDPSTFGISVCTFRLMKVDNIGNTDLILDQDISEVFHSNTDQLFPGLIQNALAVPLPINLKSFDAKKHTSSSAKLDWTTSKEVNSDYFGIERSKDGSTWDNIGRVKAAGDSNSDLAYAYIDNQLPLSRTNGQVFYYRLRMTDLDGAYKYSDVRGVNFDRQALGPITIYPNPTTEIVNIDLSEVDMQNGDVSVSVYDMSGRQVMTKKIIGNGIELIKVDQLPSDAYNFIVRQGGQIYQQRVIKID